MVRLLIFLLLFVCNVSTAQQIFSAIGASASFLEMKQTDPQGITRSAYPRGIVRPNLALGYETSSWKKLSLTIAGTYFTSGGLTSNHSTSQPKQLLFDNFCLGASGNYYIGDSKTACYIGLGPRLDYIRSQEGVYSEAAGDSYYQRAVRVLKFGVTGSLGMNFQLDNVTLGIKANYYYRPEILNKDFSTQVNTAGLYNPYRNITIQDNVFDLQFIIGYRFGVKKE